MAHSIAWSQVSRDYVLRAVAEYDRLGAQQFFADHGFAPAICIARRQAKPSGALDAAGQPWTIARRRTACIGFAVNF
jgi:hypothetical protein